MRKNSICSLSITIIAFGQAGNVLLKEHPDDWKNHIQKIKAINWDKNNPEWENCIVVNGSVVASRSTQQWLTDYIKNFSGLTKESKL